MGQWLATVRFDDGKIRHARYSTVVESVLSGLYPAANRDGPRAEPAGEPSRGRPESPPAPLDLLSAVRVEVEPDQRAWHAVFDPWRDLLVGPLSAHHRAGLQEEFSLRPDASGVRHLTKGPPVGLCGRTAAGDELPFRRPHWCEMPAEGDLPEIDLFADWTTGTVCRECLVATL